MVRVGVIGGAGFTGGELLRILIHHPNVEIVFIHSRSQAGKPIYSTHQDLIGETDLVFTDQINTEVDVVFLCMGHGDSKVFLTENSLPVSVKIVDLSQDFRIEVEGNTIGDRAFVYGLPELNRAAVESANNIANPGCFATAIQLALLPIFAAEAVKGAVHVSAITGSTGAGQKLQRTTGFTWRLNNVSVYKAFTHQHLREIKQTITQLQDSHSKDVFFIPYRGNFSRGIFASVYMPVDLEEEELINIYKEYYKDCAFTHVVDEPLDLKKVVNTNKCLIKVSKQEGQLFVESAIDNLLKGASGQAVQNMNLMFGLPENAGLNLKASVF